MAVDKEKMIKMVLQKLSKKPTVVEVESEDESYDKCEMCAEEMLAAIKDNDPKAFSEALKGFISVAQED